MAASPGNMYQKQALKKRPTSYLQSSTGSLSKIDKCKEKDIPLNSIQPPSSPIIERGSNISLRKFSEISLDSDASEAVNNHTPDANSNTHKKHVGTPKNAIRKIHHQVCNNWLRWNITKPLLVKFIGTVVWCLLKDRGVIYLIFERVSAGKLSVGSHPRCLQLLRCILVRIESKGWLSIYQKCALASLAYI